VAEAPPAPPVFVPATSKRKSDPPYPKIAQRRGWEGTVLLEVDVSENGRPRSVKVIGSSGRQLLDQAALRDVQSWLFNPATRDGKAVDSTMTVTFKFKLTKS
jgi:protein TonB